MGSGRRRVYAFTVCVRDDDDKTFEFHSYPDAGHAFFSVDRPSFSVVAALDGWQQIWSWFGTHLSG